jgi:hypothetical protein
VTFNGDGSYNEDVTPEELWRAVGELLLVQRTRLKLNPIDVERNGGPTYKTVQTIELGEIGRVDILAKHAAALGLSIVDVLRSALDTTGALSPEKALIVRKFEQTTVAGRTALLALAHALPDEPTAAAPQGPHRLPDDRPRKAPRKP